MGIEFKRATMVIVSSQQTRYTCHMTIFYAQNQVKNDAPALVLIHGAGGTHEDWPLTLREWQHTAVYALDLPGHGRSTPPHHDSIPTYAQAVNQWVGQIGLGRVILAGHSMGGAIAQQIALQAPAWLNGLILVATAAHFPINPQLLTQIQTDYPSAARFMGKYAWSRTAERTAKIAQQKRFIKHSPQLVHDDFLACQRFDNRPHLAQINIPTLIISGDQDKLTPPALSDLLHEAIPNSQHHPLPNAGHFLMLEQPHKVTQLIADFQAKNN